MTGLSTGAEAAPKDNNFQTLFSAISTNYWVFSEEEKVKTENTFLPRGHELFLMRYKKAPASG